MDVRINRDVTRTKWSWLILSLLTAATGACISHASEPILVEREVFVPELYGNPSALARLSDGGFVIVGSAGTGWAVRTDANGKPLWKFEEPRDPNQKTSGQSILNSGIALPDGHILLCGQSLHTDEYGSGLVIILDDQGKLIERRIVTPKIQGPTLASLESVVPWGDGFGLSGVVSSSSEARFWLLKLNKSGGFEWETVGGAPAFNVIAGSDGSLVRAASPKRGESAIVRVDEDGKQIVSRDLEFSDVKLVQPYVSNEELRLVVTDSQFKVHLVSLGRDWQVKKADVMPEVNIRDGAAFNLPDGSVALFGSQSIEQGSAYRATVARWGQRAAMLEMPVPHTGNASFSYRGAVRIAPSRFVGVRDEVRDNSSGAVLSWVSFN
jgi:hypothetical protein